MECSTCRTKDSTINCPHCNIILCQDCFLSFLTASNLTPNCSICNVLIPECTGMHCHSCNEMINLEYINANTTADWRKHNYEKNTQLPICIALDKESEDHSEEVSITTSETSNPKEIIPIIGECSICIQDITKNNIISCDVCKNSCCKDCFKRFILDNGLNSNCMHCKAKISREFIIQNLDDEWLKNEYKDFRKKHLFMIEKGKFSETQAAADIYMKAKYIITKLPFDPVSGEFKGNITNFNKYIDHRHVFNDATICIIDYGMGWEGHNFETGIRNENQTPKKTIKCPLNNCSGIIPITGEDELTCVMCYGNICSKCQESLHSTHYADHKCNENTVKTINDLRENTRSCPTCASSIFKIEGCDQMFCTQCHTTFSWNTARIERGFQHNPHYLDWVREQRMKRIALGQSVDYAAGGGGGDADGGLAQAQPQCLDYITYENLITCFPHDIWKESFEARKKIPQICNLMSGLPSNEFYCLALRNFHGNILEVRSTAGNHANMIFPNNHELRVRYLTNNMEEDEFKEEIERKEYEWHENITLFYIYDMVFRSAGDIYHNLYSKKTVGKFKDIYHDIYIEILKLIEYGNNCLYEHDKAYKTVSMKFKKRPF